MNRNAILQSLFVFANKCDEAGCTVEADAITNAIQKIAAVEQPQPKHSQQTCIHCHKPYSPTGFSARERYCPHCQKSVYDQRNKE
jgi:hypothetical protein